MNKIKEIKKIIRPFCFDKRTAFFKGSCPKPNNGFCECCEEEARQLCQLSSQPLGDEDWRELAHYVISHIWQFARGSGYPFKWEIKDADFRSVLKFHGIKWGEERQKKGR